MAKTPEERIGVVEAEVGNLKIADTDLKTVDNEQWIAINDIRNFMHKLVPMWVTFVLTAAGFITGSALTFAGMLIKVVGK